ncbi:MAG: hypothetical protein HY905_09935 [Deltaproteobacteria bacterium]|nr:hypothetical protein [Deltaproteobacteria bacterium]
MHRDQSGVHVVSAELGRWLGGAIPDAVVEAARARLAAGLRARRLRGSWVRAFGGDLHLHLTTFADDFAPEEDPAAIALGLAREAIAGGVGRCDAVLRDGRGAARGARRVRGPGVRGGAGARAPAEQGDLGRARRQLRPGGRRRLEG